MPDPNRTRDRALIDIAGYLKSIDRSLREIVRQNKVSTGLLPLDSYLRGEDSAADPASGIEHTGPYIEGTS
jgi:hypothetical protein